MDFWQLSAHQIRPRKRKEKDEIKIVAGFGKEKAIYGPLQKMQTSLLAAPNLQYTDVFKQEIQIVIKIFQHWCSNTIPSQIPAIVPFLRGEVGVHRPVTGYHKLHSLTLCLRQAGYSQSAVTQTASRSNVLITAASEYICKTKT